MVGVSLAVGDSDFADGRLPLTIVDWHTEQAKFDSGPYVTTILGLDWLVSECLLGIPPVLDLMNYDALQKVLDNVRESVGVELTEAQVRLDTARQSEIPFEFATDDDGGELLEIED